METDSAMIYLTTQGTSSSEVRVRVSSTGSCKSSSPTSDGKSRGAVFELESGVSVWVELPFGTVAKGLGGVDAEVAGTTEV